MTSLRLVSVTAVLIGATVLASGCGFGGDTTTVTVTSPTATSDVAPDSTTPTAPTTPTTPSTPTTATVTVTTATTAPAPVPVKVNPVMQANEALQSDLTTLGFYNGPISGVYGPLTRTAVANFQRAAQLPADGIAGAQTQAAINLALGNPNTDAVNLLQNALTGLCYYSGPVDGVFGSGTEAALIAFQKKAGIKADGRYGPATAAALAKAWPGRPSSCTNSGGGGGNATGETATITSPSINRTFDLTSCTTDGGVIAATGTAGNGINLGIESNGGPGAQIVVKGGGYGLQGNVRNIAISSNSQFRMSGTWGNNGQKWTVVGTCD